MNLRLAPLHNGDPLPLQDRVALFDPNGMGARPKTDFLQSASDKPLLFTVHFHRHDDGWIVDVHDNRASPVPMPRRLAER